MGTASWMTSYGSLLLSNCTSVSAHSPGFPSCSATNPSTTSLCRPLIDPERSIRNEMCTGASVSSPSHGPSFSP